MITSPCRLTCSHVHLGRRVQAQSSIRANEAPPIFKKAVGGNSSGFFMLIGFSRCDNSIKGLPERGLELSPFPGAVRKYKIEPDWTKATFLMGSGLCLLVGLIRHCQ